VISVRLQSTSEEAKVWRALRRAGGVEIAAWEERAA